MLLLGVLKFVTYVWLSKTGVGRFFTRHFNYGNFPKGKTLLLPENPVNWRAFTKRL